IDGCVVEPIGKDGEPTRPGDTSDRILVTNLHNFTQPVLRYEMHDRVIPLDGPCPCGSILPAMHVIGREDDTLYCRAPDGSYVRLPPMSLETVMLESNGYSTFQIRQIERDRIRVRFVPGHDVDNPEMVRQRIRSRFAEYLGDQGLSAVMLEVECCRELERSAT